MKAARKKQMLLLLLPLAARNASCLPQRVIKADGAVVLRGQNLHIGRWHRAIITADSQTISWCPRGLVAGRHSRATPVQFVGASPRAGIGLERLTATSFPPTKNQAIISRTLADPAFRKEG